MKKLVLTLLILITFKSFLFANDGLKIWLNNSIITENTKLQEGTVIFYPKWVSTIEKKLEKKDISIALQLDDSLDPIPNDSINFPSIKVLGALTDFHLLDKYFRKFKKYAYSKGIQFVVLPDTLDKNKYEKEVINTALVHSPDFFISKNDIISQVPKTKKEFQEFSINSSDVIIVNSEKGFKKYAKWERKVDIKNQFFRPTFNENFALIFNQIKSKTISAINFYNQFPIRRRAVTYLGNDEKLKKRLSQYVNVFDKRTIDVLTIYDNRFELSETIQSNDILIRSFKQKNDTLKQSSIIIPEIGELSDVELCKMLFGAKEILGRQDHPKNEILSNYHYLSYSEPHLVGLDTLKLLSIDSIAAEAIKAKAAPGMKVMVVKNGTVVFNKNYGHLTYDSLVSVNKNTLYDIASVTKVAATLPAIIWLVETGQIGLDDSVSKYIQEFKKTDKETITIRQLLSHNAGLISYAAFWKMAMRGDFIPGYMRKEKKLAQNPAKTFDNKGFMKINAKDSIIKYIGLSKLKAKPQYKYSDLGFILLQTIVERVSKQSFESFIYSKFYQPMNIFQTGFKPLEKGFDPKNIAPTELDTLFRGGLALGEVHDRNALLLGGVAGHAGLFSDAEGLAKMMLMFCNNGFYGGKRYFTENTLNEFNKRHFPKNRRGLGWDKPLAGKQLTQSKLASDESFGHTGFTGNIVWADPKHDLIYIFLSNRTLTGSNNWKLNELKIRTRIHDAIYQSLTSTNN